MIFPPRPKGIERDQTTHGRLYYTSDDLKRYGLQCVEEYKRCMVERANQAAFGEDVGKLSKAFSDLFSKMGVK